MSEQSGSFTPTQQAMLNVLADGLPHRREELHACLPDELGALTNIHRHLVAMRKLLRPEGQEIICQLLNRRYYYRLVRPLNSCAATS